MDDALIGDAAPPEVLRDYLLAMGERGIGYAAVYGDAPLSVERYELLSWLQQRVALAATEEGRKSLGQERRMEAAIAFEAGAASVAGGARPAPPPFDAETMTPGEVADWLARYGPGSAYGSSSVVTPPPPLH